MPLSDYEVKALVVDLLKTQTARDKQSKIGASEIGNPCDYCVASRLAGKPKVSSEYWLGARIGTGIHAELEREIAKHTEEPQGTIFNALKGAASEYKMSIYDMEGYGLIKSTADLLVTNHLHLIDFKTSKKRQVDKYKLDGVPLQYVVQQQLYGYGFNQLIPGLVKRISLMFINRDGSTDSDFWVHSFDYDEQVALDALARLEVLWTYVREDNNIEALNSHPECFYCNVVIHR